MKGLRKMPKFLDLGLKVVLSVSMVMGSVPTAALAEVLDDEPQVEEGVVIEEGQVDEGDLALVNDDAAAEEAVVEEVTPTDDAALADEVAVAEEAATAEEPTVAEEATLPVETAAPEAEPAPVQEAPATKDEPEDAGIELVAQTDDSSFDELVENAPFEVELDESRHWVGKFTAPRDDTFSFYSESMYDTHGCLYADEALTDELDSNTGVEGNSFLITRYLNEGDIVYLEVMQYSYDVDTCVVRVERGIPLRVFGYRATTTLVYDGQPKSPAGFEIGNFGYESFEPLTPGVDYELIGWEDYDTGEQLTDEPIEIGTYYAIYEGRGDYSGQYRISYRIVDSNDLSNASLDLQNWRYGTTGNSVVLDATVRNAADIELVEGEDFTFAYYYEGEIEVDDGEGGTYTEWGYVELDEAPSAPGQYYVRAVATGDTYTGSTDYVSFSIVDSKDLRYGSVELPPWGYETSGDPIELGATVYDAAGNELTEDEDFVFEYSYWGETEIDDGEYGTYLGEDYITLDGAPSEPGEYYVRAVAMGDEYEGATLWCGFYVNEAYDVYNLNNGYVSISESVFEVGQELDFDSYVHNGDGDLLSEGVDYQFKCYTNEAGEELDGEPNEVGIYYAVYEGIEPYTGTRSARFVIIEPVTPVDMALGTVDVEIASESYWIGVFTASESGYYSFYSEGDYDTDGYLYYDAELSEEFASDGSSGDGNNFLLTTYLYAGQTVYVKVCNCEGEEIGCSVTAINGVSLPSLFRSHEKDRFAFDGNQHIPVVVFFDADHNELVEGTDYRLKHFLTDEGEILAAVPTEIGSYYAVYEGIGSYLGTVEVWFEIVDGSDLSSASISLNTSHPKLIDGSINLVATVTDVAGNELVEGVHYELSYEGYNDNDDLVSVEVPTTSGEYFVKATAIEGGGYTGATDGCWFTVVDPYDIGGDDYSCYFNGSYNKPLVDGTFDLSDLVLSNYVEDTRLILGTDYEIAGYQDNYGAAFTNPPTEPGWYRVVVRGINTYKGVSTCSFRLYDPYDLSGASVSLQGSIDLYDEMSDRWDEYYFFEGSPVEPTFSVYLANDELPSSAYTVTYANNDHVHEADEHATLTITGVAPYTGSTTVQYKVVDALDLESVVYASDSYAVWNGQRDFIGWDDVEVEYLATGQAIKPTVEMTFYYDGPNAFISFQPDVDYTCSYEDASGNVIDAAREIGTYTLVISGVEGGKLTGTMRVPFSLVETVNLDYGFDASLNYNGSYSQGGPYYTGFTINDLGATISDLAWSVWRNGTQLVENLDYAIEYVANAVGDMVDVVFRGIGSYTGTVRSAVYFDQTAQDSLNNRRMVRSTIYGFESYARYSVVYVDSTGVIEAPQVTVSGLTQGIDYVVDGVYDQQGNLITTASVGDEVTVKVTGIGAYADATRSFDATVVEGTAAPSMTSYMVYLLLQNAWTATVNGSNQYFMKRGETPAVYLQVYGKNLLLQEGQGFTVTTALSDDNDTMTVTAVADDSGLVSGSDTLTVNLADTFNFGEVFALSPALSYVGVTGLDDTVSYRVGSSNVATLNYRGYAFMPSVSFMRFEPDYTAALYRNARSAGTPVDAITGPGDYTMVITGTGDWSGTFEVPLHVVEAIGEGLALSRCRISLGDAQLVNGKAEPSVTVSYGDTAFTKDTDYTVEYGNNTTAGAHAWVRITAVEGGCLTGLRSFGFTVADDATSMNLSSGKYSLLIQDPTAYHGSSYYQANGYTMRAHAVGDEPRVLVVDETTSTPLTSSDYDVTYGNNMTPGGLAYVTVTGKGDYTGSRSANYYVYGADERPSIENAVVTVEDQTFTGTELNPAVTVTLDGATLVEGTDYTVTYSNAVHVGTATVTVLGKGAYKGAASGTFQIAPYQLTDDAVSGVEDKSYAGGAEVTLSNLTVTALGKTLVAGTDYEVAYQNNTQVGEATVTVTGMGDYTGTVTKTFQIRGNSLNGATISAIEDQTYTGFALEPAITVTLGDKTLTAGTDYTVSYANNVNAGTATVTVTGAGEYFDSAQATFVIVGKPVTVTATNITKTYGDPDPEFGVSFEGLLAGDSIDYAISREPGENAGKYAITPAGEEVQGNYVVNFVAGELTIASKYLSGTMVGGIDNKTYTGSEVTQDGLFVKDGDTTLVAGVDYTVAYGSNINVGTVWVTVVGKGNYTGTTSTTFQIMPKPVEGLQIEGEAKTYSGSALTTDVTVKDGETTLVEGTDFTVVSGSFANNVNAGTGTFVISGMGNYTGQTEGTFTINPKAVTVTANDLTKTYGEADPALTATPEGLVGGDEVAYTVSREPGEAAGTYAVTPAGEGLQGNYSVTFVPGTLTVAAKPLSGGMVGALGDLTYTGEALEPRVTVTDGDAELVPGADYAVAYDGNVNAGTAEVTVTGMGNYQGTVSTEFRVLPKDVTVTANDLSKALGEADPTLTATVEGLVGEDEVAYELSREPGEAAGTYAVTPTGEELQGNYRVTFVAGALTITARALAEDMVGELGAQVYTGSAIEPDVTVTDGDAELVPGVDYTVLYSDNISAGTGKVTIVGAGDYSGEVHRTFRILPKAVTVTANSFTKTYGDSDPEFDVSVEGLLAGDEIDYTITRAPGEDAVVGGDPVTYAITPAGDEVQGNYVVTFVAGELTIEPKSISGATVAAIAAQTYTGSEIKPALTVKDGGTTLVVGADYTVEYRNNTNASTGTASVTVNGVGNYKDSIEGITFDITPKPIAGLQISGDATTYTGSELTTTVTVKDGTKELDANDFTVVSYSDNINAGTGKFVVTGKGNYTGQADGTFTIDPKTVTITVNDVTKIYRAADPTFTATVDGLVETGTEEIISYKLTRETGSNVGTYAIGPSEDTEMVQGNYRLTFVPGTLTIKPRSIAKATVATIAAQTYTGNQIKPKLTVKDGTKALVLNTDYTVTYKNNVSKGTATVTIKGKGNYSSSKSVTFKIAAASVAKATVSKIANQKYDGKAKTPSPTVKVGTRTLKKGTDYTLTYKNNQKAGTATVTIKGKGNYTGSKSVTFKIVAMAGTWKGSGSKWWYQWKDGKYPASVFLDISGKTYYFDASGYCVYGWRQISGKYYYFESSGAMAKSKWVGNYYLKADGTMARNEWVDGGKYHVDANGKYDKKR